MSLRGTSRNNTEQLKRMINTNLHPISYCFQVIAIAAKHNSMAGAQATPLIRCTVTLFKTDNSTA